MDEKLANFLNNNIVSLYIVLCMSYVIGISIAESSTCVQSKCIEGHVFYKKGFSEFKQIYSEKRKSFNM